MITYSFLHLNWQHIILNLIALWWLGRLIEQRVGCMQFAAVYGMSAILAGITILLWHGLHPANGSAVGASGGIFGLLGTALVLDYHPDAQSFNPSPGLKIRLWIFLLNNLGISFQPGVSIAGHIGGFLTGLAIGTFVKVNAIDTSNAY